jgi:hypothetical protein
VAVYEGVLVKVSGGDVISSQGSGGYYTHRVGISRFHKTGVDQQAGYMRRQFVDIGDTRIRNVILRRYYDELLQEAVGQEVALSITGPSPSSEGRHTVVAMRTPKGGVVRPSRKQLFAGSIVLVFQFWIAAVFMALILAAIALFVGAFTSVTVFWIGLAVAVAFGIGWMILPFYLAWRTFKAASALDGAPLSAVPTSPYG